MFPAPLTSVPAARIERRAGMLPGHRLTTCEGILAGQKRSANPPLKRSYTLRSRAASMAETRARIVDAALELYETTGPAATTMTAVAEAAGVTRATLYRHFRSDADMASAVIDEWRTGSPTADAGALAGIEDPAGRLRWGLAGLYQGYRATAAMTAKLLRDAHVLPASRQADLRAAARGVRDGLAGSFAGRNAAPATAAALGHAVAFETWRSLSGEGLDDPAIAELMVMLVTTAAMSNARSPARSGGSAQAPAPNHSPGRAAARGPRAAPLVVDAARGAPESVAPDLDTAGGPREATHTSPSNKPPRKSKSGKGKRGKKGKGDRKAKGGSGRS